MTITRDDIRAAVGAGKISEAQAAAITSLSDARRGARENLAGLDEPFELFRGFNEIFVVIGLAILYAGYSGITGTMSWISSQPGAPLLTFALLGMLGIGFAAAYFTRIRRMVAPSIALAIMFALSSNQAGYAIADLLDLSDGGAVAFIAGLTTVLMLGYWLLFRVPFAMLIIALGTYVTAFAVTTLTGQELGDFDEIFVLSANSAFPWVTLALGLIGLMIAMHFDMSDPHRVTRRSAQGFWLHIIAAPAIVNTVALTLFEADSASGYVMLSAFLVLMAVFAIVIDRRSFLISGIGYAVALLATIADTGIWVFIFFLGLFLVLLGAFWEKIRGGIVGALPNFPGKDRLPPWTTSKEINE